MPTQSPHSPESDLDDARRHLTALRDIEWLLALDDLWTSNISVSRQETRDGDPDFAALGRLARDMDRALKGVPQVAMHVLRSLDVMDDDTVGYALRLIRETVPGTASVTEWLYREDNEASARMTLVGACIWVSQEAEIERAILRKKTALLKRGELPDPDLRPLFRCMGSLVGMGAGIALAAAGTVSVLGVPAVIALGGAAYVYGVAETWEKTGCKKTVRGAADALARLRTRPEGL